VPQVLLGRAALINPGQFNCWEGGFQPCKLSLTLAQCWHHELYLLIFKDQDTQVPQALAPLLLYFWCRDFTGKPVESTMELISGFFTANVLFHWSINNSGKFGTSCEEIVRGRFVFPPKIKAGL